MNVFSNLPKSLYISLIDSTDWCWFVRNATQRVNYILDFAARNSFLLDRQAVPVFSWPNLPYLCETCPIKVQSIFSRHYVFAHLPIHAWSKSNLFLVIGGRCFSRDVHHQRKRWPHSFIILFYATFVRLVCGQVQEFVAISGWWRHLPRACSFLPVRPYFFL